MSNPECPDIAFELVGPRAAAAADDLRALLADLVGPAAVRAAPAPRATPGDTKDTDPLVVATLVFTIPSGLLATLDLAKRLRLAEAVRRLQAWAVRNRAEGGPAVRVRLPAPPGGGPGRARDLAELEPADLLDAAPHPQENPPPLLTPPDGPE